MQISRRDNPPRRGPWESRAVEFVRSPILPSAVFINKTSRNGILVRPGSEESANPFQVRFLLMMVRNQDQHLAELHPLYF